VRGKSVLEGAIPSRYLRAMVNVVEGGDGLVLYVLSCFGLYMHVTDTVVAVASVSKGTVLLSRRVAAAPWVSEDRDSIALARG